MVRNGQHQAAQQQASPAWQPPGARNDQRADSPSVGRSHVGRADRQHAGLAQGIVSGAWAVKARPIAPVFPVGTPVIVNAMVGGPFAAVVCRWPEGTPPDWERYRVPIYVPTEHTWSSVPPGRVIAL